MKPDFALSLSFEGISLLLRATDGWRTIGEVSLETEDLASALADLGRVAAQFKPGDLFCKIIIPNDQIRYLSIQTGAFEGETRHEMARAALEGVTPYDVADLAFDLSFEDGQTHIAAVARATLEEAETFAQDHGFRPVSFVAIPGDMVFQGEPFFGVAASLPNGTTIDPDDTAVVVTGPAIPPPPPAPEPAPPPPLETEQVSPPDEATPTVSAGFASRRGKSSDDVPAPPLPGAARPLPALDGASAAQDRQETDTGAPLPETAPVSVTAPTLDVPDNPAAEPVADVNSPATGAGRFLTRRKSRQAKPAPSTSAKLAPTPIAPAPAPQDFGPRDETERMTIFGARDQNRVGGKPRHLGLMLTLGLLLFLLAVAAWASVFLEDGVAGLFRTKSNEVRTAEVPELRAPDVLTTSPASLPAIIADDPEAVPESTGDDPAPVSGDVPVVSAPDALTAPAEDVASLTDTDAAVLEALRETELAETVTVDQEQAQYAATGIWQHAPEVPDAPAIVGLDDLYEVSIDRTDLAQDAVALPPASTFETDQTLTSVSSPAAAGTTFALDASGLVRATVEGTLNPDGVVVYLGKPPVVPPATPTRFEAEVETDAVRDRLAGLRPRLRPGDLVEKNERSQLGGLTRAELGKVRPKLRPRTAKQEEEVDETPTAQAVVVSRVPSPRPRDFASKVEKAQQRNSGPSTQVAAAVVAPSTVSPKIPTSASVARQATMDNAINLRQINLIGVYGTPSDRRALLRLPSGRYKKVKVGDSVDGGRILAIGDSELRYQKSGRNVTLKIPSG